ncbi:geminin coiled-coil domain-containing protein 1 [Paramormyrops kingsleyae]|uniref:Geminin coiled-coil domain containing n=1 Tax=Paramormyrops kingsleyae TaxID=1676925 RepID=A0A3B3R8E2_9TELE|nr:geminin coiled-coil domain-containing protein 1 [Paramormyrops kingsleyae]
MSTALSCQDVSFVGGQRYDGPYSIMTSLDSVDVSRETLDSYWSAGPLDNTACQHEPPQQDTINLLNYVTESSPHWTDLSPQLLRNKQLQDILLQREEELARLHEENNKLKEFLNSSFVKCLEEKTKIVLSAQTGYAKKSKKRTREDEGRLYPSHFFSATQGKRTLQNLSLDFCPTEERAAAPPTSPCLLQTLPLRNQDSIDSSKFNTSSDPCIYRSPTVSPSSHCDSGVNSDPSSFFNSPANHYSTYSVDINSLPHGNVINTEIQQAAQPDFLFKSDDLENYNLVSTALLEVHTPYCLKSNNTPQTHHRLLGSNIAQCSSPYTPQGRTDLAFTMSLNPSSGVRTHSYPQGQAFVRRDTHGGWNFTWIPKHVH